MDSIGNMSDAPMVSVVVMTYNHERFIRRCLDGIVMQRVDFPIEVLVIDDASTDSNAAIIREYADRYPDLFRVFLKNENGYSRGICHFNDTVVPYARGKYIALCEGDDYWTDADKLQCQVDFLERHPRYSSCFHLYKIVDEQGKDLEQKYFNIRRSRRCGVHDMLVEMQSQTAAMIFRREIFERDRELREDMKRSPLMDVRLNLALINYGRVYCIHRYMSVYRVHSGGVSQNVSSKEDIEKRHMRVLESLSHCYGGRYKSLPRRYQVHLRMREMLDEATRLRKGRKYLSYLKKMFVTFCVSPRHFCRIYYTAYR